MELHKANLEAAQPMATSPNLALNQFLPQMNPFYPGCFPAGQAQLNYGALMAGQQQLAQQPNVQQQPMATALPAPAVSLASTILQQQPQAVGQQQLVNTLVSHAAKSPNPSMIPGAGCFVNGAANGSVSNVMSVNNLAAALPIAYFLTKPSAVTQSGGQSCSGSCTGTTTTVSSSSQFLNLANGSLSAQQQQQQAAAAMLGLQSLAAVQQQVAAALPISSHTSSSASSTSSLNNSYHVTPKLKSPAGLLTVSSGRGTDKFSPY
jgi:hypothetical protein